MEKISGVTIEKKRSRGASVDVIIGVCFLRTTAGLFSRKGCFVLSIKAKNKLDGGCLREVQKICARMENCRRLKSKDAFIFVMTTLGNTFRAKQNVINFHSSQS